ncbi:MAG: hypothetical protein K8R60_03300 [Burkholderiales bacterium]|nr:hypothetical protein [Burkholderiales bacterium]
MVEKSKVREVLEAIGSSPSGMTDEKDAVALLDIHLGHVQACNDSDDLVDLIEVRDSARKALFTTFQIRTTSQLARSHADPLVNALAPLERLIENMEVAQRPKGGKAQPKGEAPKVEAPKVEPPLKAKPKLKVPYPVPPVALRRDIPSTWKAEKIVTEELFREMLDVHSELFDGQLPTTMNGISVAVLDKLGIGLAYVEAQVWDEKEDGKFNPKNKDHQEAALAMAPAMVTIVPTKDPKRTVYVNADEYKDPKMGGNGTEPNYDAVNAVMLHESHHASSKGFVNELYFKGDQALSWKFDECVTEYFTKKVWDSKYADRADDYFKYTNYFKSESAKKGWYGEAGRKIAAAVGEKVLAAAYFGGEAKALQALAASNKEIERLVREIM